MNKRRRKGREARRIDVMDMRDAARALLGFSNLHADQAAEFIGINSRTWRKYEAREKQMPDTLIKLFWYEVALTKLENLEEEDTKNGTKKLEEALGGPLTVTRLFDFIHAQWEEWDPTNLKHEKEEEAYHG